MKYPVFKQVAPVPTGRKFTYINTENGETVEQEWHAANLKFVGYAASFKDARKLCPIPVMGVTPWERND